MNKRFVLFLLAILPMMASAYDAKIGKIYYNFNLSEKTATVTYLYGDLDERNGSAYSGDVTIPASVTYKGEQYSVTRIGSYAFSNCSGMTSITIPSSMKNMDLGAFYNCSDLTSVTIPNSVTSIGDRAFKDCTGLTSVTIGNNVTNIGNHAFCGCSSLTFITIPNSVTSIGDYAFNGCSGLTSVTIPNSVTSIAKGVFKGCI